MQDEEERDFEDEFLSEIEAEDGSNLEAAFTEGAEEELRERQREAREWLDGPVVSPSCCYCFFVPCRRMRKK